MGELESEEGVTPPDERQKAGAGRPKLELIRSNRPSTPDQLREDAAKETDPATPEEQARRELGEEAEQAADASGQTPKEQERDQSTDTNRERTPEQTQRLLKELYERSSGELNRLTEGLKTADRMSDELGRRFGHLRSLATLESRHLNVRPLNRLTE